MSTTGDYRDLPERLAVAVAGLIAAERNAHKDAHRCELCRRADTLNVRNAELALLHAVRVAYVHPEKAKAA